MAQSGYTPIKLYYSPTTGHVPTTGNLSLGELALNLADQKVYCLNAAGNAVITLVGTLGNQNANSVAITGGNIDGTAIGVTTKSTGAFTTLTATGNVSGNAFYAGFNSTAAGGSQVTLTSSSAQIQVITGSGSLTFQLPDATTLPNGASYTFNNNSSSGSVSVNNNSGTLIASIPSGGYVDVVLLSNATAAGSWDKHFSAPANVSWSTNTFSYPGTITGATWNGVTVGVAYGGTGLTSLTAGSIPYGAGTSAFGSVAIGTAGQVLTVNSGGTAPQWSNASSIVSGTATNIAGGTTGAIPYQSAASTTTFLSGNTSTTPQFVTSTGTGSAAQAPTLTSSTGSGNVVLATSPTLVTPALGTPSSATLTNATGLPLSTGITGTLAISNGGTGQTTQQAAINALAGAVTSGYYLRGNGTNAVMASLAAADLTGTISNSIFPTGTILQVLYNATSSVTTATTSTLIDIGLSVVITPTRSTSSIAVLVGVNGIDKSGNTGIILKLLRGASIVSNIEGLAGFNAASNEQCVGGVSLFFIDSPATTTTQTYKVQMASYNGNSVSVNGNGGVPGNSVSTIMVMEIAG